MRFIVPDRLFREAHHFRFFQNEQKKCGTLLLNAFSTGVVAAAPSDAAADVQRTTVSLPAEQEKDDGGGGHVQSCIMSVCIAHHSRKNKAKTKK